MTRLTDAHEAARPAPWSLADYIERMLRAIVGIELVVTRLKGKWKMSQNHPAPNRASVVSGLQGEGGERALEAARMVAAGAAGHD